MALLKRIRVLKDIDFMISVVIVVVLLLEILFFSYFCSYLSKKSSCITLVNWFRNLWTKSLKKRNGNLILKLKNIYSYYNKPPLLHHDLSRFFLYLNLSKIDRTVANWVLLNWALKFIQINAAHSSSKLKDEFPIGRSESSADTSTF